MQGYNNCKCTKPNFTHKYIHNIVLFKIITTIKYTQLLFTYYDKKCLKKYFSEKKTWKIGFVFQENLEHLEVLEYKMS